MTKCHSTFYFDETPVVIQVESTLFKVHKYHLLQSEAFSDMFKLPPTPGDFAEGTTPENPIVLTGVTASDFEALLTILYERRCTNDQLPLTSPLIFFAFRLAHMWNFPDVRAYLLVQAEANLDDVEKIDFAKMFGIEKWLVPAYLNLCRRPTPPTTDEATRLVVHDLLMIFRLREQYRPWDPMGDLGSSSDGSDKYCASCFGFTYHTPIPSTAAPLPRLFAVPSGVSTTPNTYKCAKCGDETQSYFKRNQCFGIDKVDSLKNQLEEWVKEGRESK